MEVILLQDVTNVGEKGSLANVSRGYARNFLLPKGLAEVASPGKLVEYKRREDERKAREERTLAQAEEFAATLSKSVITITGRVGEGERLYGSVTTADIADAIWTARKIHVDKRKIKLEEPIKELGTYMIDIDLADGFSATVKTIVTAE